MKHLHCPDIESFDALNLGLEGSEKMKLRLLSEDSVWIELEPDGYTPEHVHDDKERFIVMSGSGHVKTGDTLNKLQPNDFIEFEVNEPHQILNTGETILTILCFRNQR